MKNKELIELKRGIATKTSWKILAYSTILFLMILFLIDIVFGDQLATLVYNTNYSLYMWFVQNKILVILVIYILVLFITTFVIASKSCDNIVNIINATDEILKNPSKEVELPDNLIMLEGKMNNIRIDLMTNQNTAKEAMQKKNDLIMYMAHDLKTPLTSIIGYLTLLTEEKAISKDLQEKYLRIALSKALRVEELTNQFFEITRYDLNSMQITKQNLDLTFLLEQLIEESYPMLQEKGLRCEINKQNSISYLGDGDKLARAFGNLLKNAINYSYENTTIYIDIKEDNDIIYISFKNEGDKIPKYKLEKIFEKFYRGDESRTSKTGGAGLGLAITKEIIELHRGNIFVKNDDKLIEFYIELPKKTEKSLKKA